MTIQRETICVFGKNEPAHEAVNMLDHELDELFSMVPFS